jgi:hypothetical protein
MYIFQLSGIYEQISQKKRIIQEPKRSDQVDFDELMKYFYDTIHGVNDEEDGIYLVTISVFSPFGKSSPLI